MYLVNTYLKSKLAAGANKQPIFNYQQFKCTYACDGFSDLYISIVIFPAK